MINIFDYIDPFRYLQDTFAEKKAKDPSFSYETVAQKAGFNNKGFAFNIIHGKKNLSPSNCDRINRALKHTRNQSKYFKTLIEFDRTAELVKKGQLFEKLCSIRPRGKGRTRAQLLNKDQYDYFSKWYHSAIRSLIGMYKFKNDYLWLAKKVFPVITPGKARKSVALLKRLGLVESGSNGTLKITNAGITSGPEVMGVGLRNFHFESTGLAKNAIRTLGRKDRNITGLTLGISAAAYQKICDEIAVFQEKVMHIADTAQNVDRVYQLNFHFFPLSKFERKRRRIS